MAASIYTQFIARVEELATTIGNALQLRGFKTGGTTGQIPTKTSENDFEWEWASVTGGDSFKTIAVATQSSVVADSSTDTLTLVGSGITITTDATTDTITFTATGASAWNDLTGTVDTIPFDLTPATDAAAVGELKWNVDERGLMFGVEGGEITLGKELWDTFTPLDTVVEGDVVSVVGVQGNRRTVTLTDATSAAHAQACIGMVTNVNSDGTVRVTLMGAVHKLNTNAYNEAVIYVDPANPGKWTQAAISPPNYAIEIGFVEVKNVSVGVVQVKPLAANAHTHSYLPLSGGTLTGALVAPGVTVTATEEADLFNNATDFVVSGHWTLTGGWESTNDPVEPVGTHPGTGLYHNAAGTTTATYLMDAPTIGREYKISITVNATVAGGFIFTYGGNVSSTINPTIGVSTSYDIFLKASSVANLSFIPTNTARFAITSIKIVPLVADSGKVTVIGDLLVGGKILNPSTGANAGFRVDASGVARFDTTVSCPNIVLAGLFSGATAGAFSGIVTQTTAAITTTPIAGFQAVAAIANSSPATVRYSPSLLMSGEGWNTTATASSKTNSAEFYVVPTTGSTTTGTVVCATRTVNGSASPANLFSCTFAGNFGIGTITQAAKLSINGGLHVGGDSDPGDNNALIDGTLQVVGNTTVAGVTEGVATLTFGAAATIVITSATRIFAALTSGTPCTVTMPTAASGKFFFLCLRQAGTPTTATFTDVVWSGGVAPTVTPVAGRYDMFSFVAEPDNAGTGYAWYGSVIPNFVPFTPP